MARVHSQIHEKIGLGSSKYGWTELKRPALRHPAGAPSFLLIRVEL